MKIFNWGVIGPGNIANTFAQAISTSQRGKITAVASRSKERAQAYADKYQVAKVYTDYAHLVQDSDIDIIYIATPHSLHYQYAKLCLEAGKHVLIEKPITVNRKQIECLVALAKSKQLLLQEALWTCFTPCMSELKQKLNDGVIGDIQFIHSNIGFAFQDRPDSRLFKPELAGGALLDLGVYSIAVSQFLFAEHPDKIQAFGQIASTQVDTNTSVNMFYPSGRFSQFTCTVLGQASNTMTIVGSQGYVFLPGCFWDLTHAFIYKNNKLSEEIQIPHSSNGFEYQIEESMRCVSAGQTSSHLMSHEQSIGNMRVMDEIRQQIGLDFDPKIEAV